MQTNSWISFLLFLALGSLGLSLAHTKEGDKTQVNAPLIDPQTRFQLLFLEDVLGLSEALKSTDAQFQRALEEKLNQFARKVYIANIPPEEVQRQLGDLEKLLRENSKEIPFALKTKFSEQLGFYIGLDPNYIGEVMNEGRDPLYDETGRLISQRNDSQDSIGRDRDLEIDDGKDPEPCLFSNPHLKQKISRFRNLTQQIDRMVNNIIQSPESEVQTILYTFPVYKNCQVNVKLKFKLLPVGVLESLPQQNPSSSPYRVVFTQDSSAWTVDLSDGQSEMHEVDRLDGAQFIEQFFENASDSSPALQAPLHSSIK